MEEAAASTVQGIPKPAPRRLISKTGVQTEIALHHQAPNHREYDKYKEEEHDNDTKDPSASNMKCKCSGIQEDTPARKHDCHTAEGSSEMTEALTNPDTTARKEEATAEIHDKIHQSKPLH